MKDPLIAMLGFMGLMFVVAFVVRMYSVTTGRVKMAHYEIMKGEEPGYVTRATNNLNNLFQVPVIFCCTCMFVISLNIHSSFLNWLAWAFFVSRLLHTLVHLTFNIVLIRSVIFGAGIGFLAVMWLEIYQRL